MEHQLAVSLDRGPRARPLYVQLARGVVDQVRAGRLRSGDLLPSSRALARQLGVERKTVVAAMDTLEREGWITRRPRAGVFVARDLPAIAAAPRARPAADVAGFDCERVALPARPQSPRARHELLGGIPALDEVPTIALGRAYRRALALDRRHRLIDYGDPRGEPHLRDTLRAWIAARRGIRAPAGGILVSRGAQHGLYLAGRALLAPGDAIAVEAYCHPAMTSLFRLLGLALVPIPVDAHGLDVDALARACAARRVRAVYTTPHHQLPTTATLTAGRRIRLLELARRHRLIVLEDDYDHEFRYAGPPVLPLAHLDRAGVVVYFGTLSKVVAPGLRLAFVVAPPAAIDRIAAYRAYVDHQGDHVAERAVADLIEDGELDRHLRRMVRTYAARRDALADALARELPLLELTLPSGGMAVWARAPGIDVDRWAERALAAGVSFQPASHFACGDVPLDCLRLGFAACDEAELAEAVRIMKRTLPRGRRP